MVAVFHISSAVGVRDQRVEPQHQSRAENRHSIKKNAAQAHRSNGLGAVSLPADHHRVHNRHRHPAQLRKNERDGEAQHRARFFGDVV